MLAMILLLKKMAKNMKNLYKVSKRDELVGKMCSAFNTHARLNLPISPEEIEF